MGVGKDRLTCILHPFFTHIAKGYDFNKDELACSWSFGRSLAIVRSVALALHAQMDQVWHLSRGESLF